MVTRSVKINCVGQAANLLFHYVNGGWKIIEERMERVSDCLEKLVGHLKLISKVRARAGTNGHGR